MLLTRTEDMFDFRTSGELSDICVVVGKTEFHLHKFPLFLHSEFFRALCRCGMMDEHRVTLSQFPGGAKIFALIADYCYGLQVDFNSRNAVELRCAAEFLQMTSHGNLASETSAALTQILRSQSSSVTHIASIISSACKLGPIAKQTNILSLCFDALIGLLKKGYISENITETIMLFPVEWFVDFVVEARDASVAVPKLACLAGKYLERVIQQHKGIISKYLQWPGIKEYGIDVNLDNITIEDIGQIMDAILLELPENASFSGVLDSEILCLLFTLAEQLSCKCEGILVNVLSNNLDAIPRELLVTMPTSSVVSITEHSVHNNNISPMILCNTVDNYLRERTKQNLITLEELEAVLRVIPKEYRPQHDSILLILEEFFSTTKASEEKRLQTLDATIDAYKLHEDSLRQVSKRTVIPSSFIINSAFAVSSRLRNELAEAKAKLSDKDKAIREIHSGVSNAIKGQWEYNDVTLNVTSKDASNSRVQFVKVLARDTSTGLSMEHEMYDGKLTLCVRSRESSTSSGKSTQTFLFEPFNEQLIEITRSKHENLMVGENYQRKTHVKSYWPFTDVAS